MLQKQHKICVQNVKSFKDAGAHTDYYEIMVKFKITISANKRKK